MNKNQRVRPVCSIAFGALLTLPILGCQASDARAQPGVPAELTFASDPAELVGTWMIDLRPTREADPYLVELVIEAVDGTGFSGTYYNGSPISDAKFSTSFGVLRFAFITNDGSGPYHTTGQLRNDQLTGTTHSLGRGFLMPWRGERVD